MRKNSEIKYLFEPKSIAVIGASQNPEKIGYKIVQNIVSSQFRGNIYPINPKGGELLGNKIYSSILDVEDNIDLACIAVPAKYTFDVVKECGKKGVKYLAIITSGFSEVGNLEEEKKMVSYAKKNGMRILGPNIFGIYSSIAPVNATFGPGNIKRGNVAIITQSGALGIAMIGKTKFENIGLSAIVSVGNKSDLEEAELLEYLIDDKNTKVILMYIEGIKKGEKLVSILKQATKKKPIVVIKSGRSKRGAQAAASHTGSLAGADEIFSDIMKQCGVLRAESIEEALNWSKFLSNTPKPMGENAVIITNGGGIGVMAADASEKYGVNLYDDFEVLKNTFKDAVPDFGSTKNPVDLTGQAKISDYEIAINTALKNKEIHSIICLGCETAVINSESLKSTIKSIYKRSRSEKPIVFSFFGGQEIEDSINFLRRKGVPIFSDVYEAISCLGVLYISKRRLKDKVEQLKSINIDFKKINQIIKDVQKDNRTFLLSHEAQNLMQAANIQNPKSILARNLDEATKAAEEIGYPVVMKIVSKDIIHKSDAGGVALNLADKKELIDAYQAIIYNCKKYKPEAHIVGVEVSEMVKKGTEIIIGSRRDHTFGPIVMFGLGGIYVEIMKDVSFRAYPLNSHEARIMIKEIKSYPLLLGVRGEKKKDINSIVDTILKVGAVLYNFPDITDIEINPLVVYKERHGAKAVDVRILLYNKGDLDE